MGLRIWSNAPKALNASSLRLPLELNALSEVLAPCPAALVCNMNQLNCLSFNLLRDHKIHRNRRPQGPRSGALYPRLATKIGGTILCCSHSRGDVMRHQHRGPHIEMKHDACREMKSTGSMCIRPCPVLGTVLQTTGGAAAKLSRSAFTVI